jgi:hypothetical protein
MRSAERALSAVSSLRTLGLGVSASVTVLAVPSRSETNGSGPTLEERVARLEADTRRNTADSTLIAQTFLAFLEGDREHHVQVGEQIMLLTKLVGQQAPAGDARPIVIALDQGARRIVRDDAGQIVGTEPVPEDAASAATTPRSLARKATSPPDDGSYPPAA